MRINNSKTLVYVQVSHGGPQEEQGAGQRCSSLLRCLVRKPSAAQPPWRNTRTHLGEAWETGRDIGR